MQQTITRENIELENEESEFSIEEMIFLASSKIAPVWPLKTAVACNPLLHMENRNFWDALSISRLALDQKTSEKAKFVNLQLIKWLQTFLDQGQSYLKMPSKHLGFYKSWKELAEFDSQLITKETQKNRLQQLPENPLETIRYLINQFRIPKEHIQSHLEFELNQLPGWAGYIRWHAEWNENDKDLITFHDLLAVRLAIFYLRFENFDFEYDFLKKQTKDDRRLEIESKEYHFASRFFRSLRDRFLQKNEKETCAQFVFCIDVRSEPFRRSLEAIGSYETLGFAGFFGFPIEVCKEKEKKYSSCPVLLKPKWKIFTSTEGYLSITKKIFPSLKEIFEEIYIQLKYRFATAFSLAETIGIWVGIWMALKSLKPKASCSIKSHFNDPNANKINYDSIPLSEQINHAESALKMMGFTKNFAPLVVFCGHGSTTENNPFASSLDCGACGGNHGDFNARVFASILNSKKVRSELKTRGIEIPDTTYFMGAKHNTTTDEVTLFEEEIHQFCDLNQVKQDLIKASDWKNNIQIDPSKDRYFASRQYKRIEKSIDWSESRPEWGLAKNGAFLIGPRSISKGADLGGRVFLHSYDYKTDPEGSYLETILTAPMVVAEWINMQYFFSTLDPKMYGSGSKITQNVVGKIAVMQGNGSDLMHGLPLQSLFSSDATSYHEPLRLHAVVHAPLNKIDAIIERQPILQKLFFNEWVKLSAIDPETHFVYQWKDERNWIRYETI